MRIPLLKGFMRITALFVVELIMRALKQEPYNGVRSTRWAVIRNTNKDLSNTTIKTFQEWLPDNIFHITKTFPRRGYMKIKLVDGTFCELEIFFMALDKDEDVADLKSLELTGGWINECVEIPESIFTMLRGRVNRYPAKQNGGTTWHGVFLDTNPCDDQHWYYRFAEIEKPEGWTFYRQPPAVLEIPSEKDGGMPTFVPNQGQGPYPHAENIENHNDGFGYYMDLLQGSPIEYIRVYLMGEYGTVSSGKPVFPGFRESLHVAEDTIEPLRGIPLLLARDYGRTPCVLFCQMSPRGQFRVLEELCVGKEKNDHSPYSVTDMSIRTFARSWVMPHIQQHYNGMSIISVGDPAGGQKGQANEITCMQELAAAGIPTTPASTNAWEARRSAVDYFLTYLVDGYPGMLLDPDKCPRLKAGMMGRYYYRKMQVTGDVRIAEKPEKNIYSHPCDALQYGCLRAQGTVIASDAPSQNMGSQQARNIKVRSSAGWT
jgi:hypothetical protein